MKFILIFILGSTLICTHGSAQRVNFDTLEGGWRPTPTEVKSEPNCACVSKEGCLLQPRQESLNRVSFEISDNSFASSSSSASRIINDPPPGVFCLADTVYCCNIRPPPAPPAPIILLPENRLGCGVRSSFTGIGPRSPGLARYGEYPWMVLIVTNDEQNTFIASGTLLDDFTVVTTAHNVQKYAGEGCKSLKVRVGDFYAEPKTDFPFVDVKIESIRIHKNFKPWNLHNDIALIKLDPSCRIRERNPNINAICLPEKHANFVERRCWVPGYGRTENGKASAPFLRHVDLKVLPGTLCQDLLQKFLGPSFNLDQRSFLCAGGEPGKDSCVGDGGSALVCERADGRWEIAGIVSWGVEGKCGIGNVPGVYTNVASFVTWIYNNGND